tara:strand:- start:103 stop:777 length:675 start_codon:yes stop_codon:yes gene_type:complete
MQKELLVIVLAVIVGLTHYFSNRYEMKHKENVPKIISFSAGVSITYVLLELFPVFTEVALSINKLIFVSVLFGFITHHLIEKEIYKHNHKHELIRMLSLEENVSSFIYHFIIGMVLVAFVNQSVIQALLYFLPMITFTLVTTLPSHFSADRAIIISFSTLLGVTTAIVFDLALWLEFSLVGIVIGMLLFTVIRHHIPFGRKGKIGYFTLGFIIYSILIISSWYI